MAKITLRVETRGTIKSRNGKSRKKCKFVFRKSGKLPSGWAVSSENQNYMKTNMLQFATGATGKVATAKGAVAKGATAKGATAKVAAAKGATAKVAAAKGAAAKVATGKVATAKGAVAKGA
ncbi:MAG: hypothetical protein PHI46_07275, partial [Bacteroidales bacterium]|nr:hypothetical protein [Bacteroidales bacterium]